MASSYRRVYDAVGLVFGSEIHISNKFPSDSDVAYWEILIWINKDEPLYHTPVRMAKIHHSDTSNASDNVEPQELTHIAGENAKWYRQFGSFWKNLTNSYHTI